VDVSDPTASLPYGYARSNRCRRTVRAVQFARGSASCPDLSAYLYWKLLSDLKTVRLQDFKTSDCLTVRLKERLKQIDKNLLSERNCPPAPAPLSHGTFLLSVVLQAHNKSTRRRYTLSRASSPWRNRSRRRTPPRPLPAPRAAATFEACFTLACSRLPRTPRQSCPKWSTLSGVFQNPLSPCVSCLSLNSNPTAPPFPLGRRRAPIPLLRECGVCNTCWSRFGRRAREGLGWMPIRNPEP